MGEGVRGLRWEFKQSLTTTFPRNQYKLFHVNFMGTQRSLVFQSSQQKENTLTVKRVPVGKVKRTKHREVPVAQPIGTAQYSTVSFHRGQC